MEFLVCCTISFGTHCHSSFSLYLCECERESLTSIYSTKILWAHSFCFWNELMKSHHRMNKRDTKVKTETKIHTHTHSLAERNKMKRWKQCKWLTQAVCLCELVGKMRVYGMFARHTFTHQIIHSFVLIIIGASA